MELTSESTVLVLVDWQERLLAAMPEKVLARHLQNAQILSESASLLGVPVLASEQYPQGLGTTHPGLVEKVQDWDPVEKTDFSCSTVAPFMEKLEATGRKAVILTGVETHVCVYQTARGLIEKGYSVHIPIDAVASRHKMNYKIGLGLMGKAGAVLTSTEVIVFDLLKRAGGDAFKRISKLVR